MKILLIVPALFFAFLWRPLASWADNVPPMVWPSGARVIPGELSESGIGAFASPDGADLPLGGTNEPAVAARGNIVAYASLSQMRISTNGGASFGPALFAPIPSGYFRDGDSSVGFDSQGRLFWTYLGGLSSGVGIDLFIAQVDPATRTVLPGYPVNITASPGVGLPGSSGLEHDKEWLAIDATASSAFADRIYVSWTEFSGSGVRILTTWSSDQGLSWHAVVQLSDSSEGFVWPVHDAVGPNGDVFVGYHAQPGFVGGAPDGVSGEIFVARSTDGGVTYPQKTLAYLPGQADMTFNVQTSAAVIPGTQFWLQGSVQPWILPDPLTPGRVFVVANDDPDNDNTRGDPADVFISVSTDGGAIWGTPTRIDSGPDTTFQVMPTASIDRTSGTIAVHYYDNRSRALNPNGRYLLDVYLTSSANAVPDFFADWRINDAHFDPDPGSPIRFPGPPATHRIGEYNGVSVQNDIAYSVWCGNAGLGQQTMFDAFTLPARTGVPVAGADDRGRGALDLEASRPNPFRRETSIIYALGTAGPVRLDIYDVGGRRVSGLVDRQEDAGQHAATWDGRDDRGIRMNPGIYFARLQSTGIARIRKIILAR